MASAASTTEHILAWEFPTSTYAFYKNRVAEVTDDHLKLFRYCETFGDFEREEKQARISFNYDRLPPPSRAQWRKFMAEFIVLSAACNDKKLLECDYSNIEEYIKCRISQIWTHYPEQRVVATYLCGMTRHFTNRWSLSATPDSLKEIKVADKGEFAHALEACSLLSTVLSMMH